MPAPARPSYLLLAALLVLAQAALLPLRGRGQRRPTPPDLSSVPTTIGDWQGREARPFDRTTLALLRPDAYLHRVYDRPDGASVVITVVYGHQKSSFHSPGFCLLGGGWSILDKRVVTAPARTPGERPLPLNRFLLQRRDSRAVVLYSYLQGRRATTSWTAFQGRLFWDRMRGGAGAGALLRLVVRATGEGEAADGVGLDFLSQLRPALRRAMSADPGEGGGTDSDGSDAASRGGGDQAGHRYR